MKKEKILNIPNALSLYRLLALPFIVSAIVHGDKILFITLLSINLVTDILDGLIARTFKMETELGARLDSLADTGTYAMAFAGMIVLENEFVSQHAVAFILLISLYIIPQLVSLIRFRRTPSLHLYSNKILGYIQGIFIFTYFILGYNPWYFYFMITASCLAYIEELAVIVLISGLRSNVRSIYFILKEGKKTGK